MHFGGNTTLIFSILAKESFVGSNFVVSISKVVLGVSESLGLGEEFLGRGAKLVPAGYSSVVVEERGLVLILRNSKIKFALSFKRKTNLSKLETSFNCFKVIKLEKRFNFKLENIKT